MIRSRFAQLGPKMNVGSVHCFSAFSLLINLSSLSPTVTIFASVNSTVFGGHLSLQCFFLALMEMSTLGSSKVEASSPSNQSKAPKAMFY